ncbi:MAG TPA: 4Fe-4S dicluster domain-containing protein, partial [Terriglobales bacterium]|nr:4Fe-4S dicluster domain-containing protein [Terriglobales bacterium]
GELVRAIDAGRVEMLVIVGGNPAYTASTELDFSKKLEKVPLRIRLGMYEDETSALCHWHVPETHYLESWSDARAYDGTVSIIQPLIAPLYNGRTVHEFMAAFSQQPEQSSYQIVRAYWMSQHQGADFERFWRSALHDGFIPGTAAALKQVRVGLQALPTLPEKSEAVEIIFRPDPHIYDGRFANNAWLQELPKPLTKLTWENAALVSPAMAGRMGLHSFDVVELERAGRKLKAPVLVIPGHPDNAVTVELGYGRQLAGRTGSGKGFNAYALRRSGEWFAGGVRVSKTGETWHLATTQNHHLIDVKAAIEEGEKRELVRVATLEEFTRNPNFAQEHSGEHASLYPEFRYEGYAWGMAIDLNSCIGCNACVVACQAENNIPVVGREQVIMQRAMHWLRVDTYHEGDLANPRTYFQPLPCMHCENAPCEVVCPVAATVHSSEGLNDMVYNRCVGTRYCSNNCPYKVRRFNFLLFADYTTPSLKLLYNPDVTVRSRGVMEKCTYCVQRINRARIEAEKEDRKVRDGEFTTACAQACPGDAIIFGDINDPNSRVHKLRNSARNYDLLGELNTRPRTRYLAGVRNPNPELEREQPKHA